MFNRKILTPSFTTAVAAALIGSVALVVTVLILGRNLMVRLVLEKRLTAATGFETSVGRVQVELTRPSVRLFHVRVFNPARLGSKPFVDVLEARVTYDFTELLSRRFKVRELQVLVAEVRFVRQDPKFSTQTVLGRARYQAQPLPDTLVAPLEFTGVDRLVLTAEHFRYVDYFEMTQSQDLLLGLRGAVATNLVEPADWDALWRRIAETKGIQPPPVSPVKPATNTFPTQL
jgi:hypothetical protein